MSILELLSKELGGNAVQQISRQVGANEEATSKAVSAALPLLVTALAKNSSNSGGAASLLGALDRDHDGSILDDVAGFLGGGGGGGQDILGHMLGSRQKGAEGAIGKASGLNSSQVGSILAMLAPLVMGALGKKKQSSGLDLGGLTDLLQGERRQVEKAQPQGMDFLGKMLDADGDGEITDDIAKMGMGMLGKMFSKR